MKQLTLGAFLFLQGCAAMGPMGRARTLPTGNFQIAGGPHVALISAGGIKLPSVGVEAAVRRGFSDSMELGVRAWGLPGRGFHTYGGALESKFQLLRAGDGGRSFDVAIGPSAGYHQINVGGTPTHALVASVPVLLGKHISERHELIFGPRVMDQLVFSDGARPVNLFFAGGSVGWAWRVGRKLSIMPELSLLFSPTTVRQGDAEIRSRGSSILEFQLGLLFDP